jgi:HD-GYP domain-containing protein (c-di-GMP phosphodiesterase class II)
MPVGIRATLPDLILAFSNSLDFAAPEYPNHHKMVAYLSFKIAEEMELPQEEKISLLTASLIHDAGLLSKEERGKPPLTDPRAPGIHRHGLFAYLLLKDGIHNFLSQIEVDPHLLVLSEELRRQGFTSQMASIILYHHISWEDAKKPAENYILRSIMKFTAEEVPFSSFILHLSDMVYFLIDHNRFILHQSEEIKSKVKELAGKIIPTEVVEAFLKVSARENIWLELMSPRLGLILRNSFPLPVDVFETRDVLLLSQLWCDFLDFKSFFTANHSRGVSETAEVLGKSFDFSEEELFMIKIAGYLHDLGKLAIPIEILEKQDKLNEHEFQLMKAHAFYTYEVLSDIKGFETIRDWAALHHERLDGSGYPFHLKDKDIPLGARIMAVADVFSALREKRPYRKVLEKNAIAEILQKQGEEGKLDKEVVSKLISQYEEIDSRFLDVQFTSFYRYQNLWSNIINILAPRA